MNTESQIIFGQGDNRWNACLANYLELSQLGRYYLESANALIEITARDTSKLDVYVYSAVFLYRHSVELLLKELIWMSNYLLGKGKAFPKHHRLMELWKTLKSNGRSLLKSDFPMNEKQVQYAETILGEVVKYDPDSAFFRYPVDKKMKRLDSRIHHINVKNLYEQFNQLHENFGQLSYMIDYLYWEQAPYSDS
ncbi:MAG: hypothetical protein ACYS74_15370 [Planctomycetota bacterium]|jgi:hypothetical protein